MKKLLRHLTNAPVAVALAFLLVGAPSAPMAKMLPSSGDAMASCAVHLIGSGEYLWDSDCDGIPDEFDPCPDNSDWSCGAPSQTSPDVSQCPRPGDATDWGFGSFMAAIFAFVPQFRAARVGFGVISALLGGASFSVAVRCA